MPHIPSSEYKHDFIKRLQRHKCSRNADSLHHQSAHDREISVFKFLLLICEKVGIIHITEESLTYTNTVTYCQVSYHVALFHGKNYKMRRRDYEAWFTLDGAAVWRIPVKLHFPVTSEKLALYSLLMHWHLRVLYCMHTACYTHKSTSWETPK